MEVTLKNVVKEFLTPSFTATKAAMANQEIANAYPSLFGNSPAHRQELDANGIEVQFADSVEIDLESVGCARQVLHDAVIAHHLADEYLLEEYVEGFKEDGEGGSGEYAPFYKSVYVAKLGDQYASWLLATVPALCDGVKQTYIPGMEFGHSVSRVSNGFLTVEIGVSIAAEKNYREGFACMALADALFSIHLASLRFECSMKERVSRSNGSLGLVWLTVLDNASRIKLCERCHSGHLRNAKSKWCCESCRTNAKRTLHW